nr:class II fructose-bisphosphate aldolase [Rubrobacter sp.]
GAYKFTKEPDREILAMNIIEEINERLPSTHLVMHGSSSVPKELVDTINRFGGEIRPTWGVPVGEIQEGIRYGVRKINVDTDLRLAATGAIRQALSESPGEFDTRHYLKPAREAMKTVVKARMEAFGQAGHASDYEPVMLGQMARRYAVEGHQLSVT